MNDYLKFYQTYEEDELEGLPKYYILILLSIITILFITFAIIGYVKDKKESENYFLAVAPI